MDEVTAIYLLLQGSPSNAAALVLNESIKILSERYYKGISDVGKDAALDYILLLSHANALTRTAAVINEEDVEAKNIWVELRKVMQTISFLRSDKTVWLKESYRLPGFTGEIIGRVLGNIEISNQLEITKAQNNALIIQSRQAEEQKLRAQTERIEKENQERLDQIENGRRGGEYNSLKAKIWQLSIKDIVIAVIQEDDKRRIKRSLKAMDEEIRDRFEKGGITIPKSIRLPVDQRQIFAYIKKIRNELSESKKATSHST